jgi:hypothetical protein
MRTALGTVAVLAVTGIGTAPAVAQTGPSSTAGTFGSMMASPYANPYMNPFLNPYMTQGSNMGRTNTLLYFFSAQQASGGLGSGRLSGSRPSTATKPGSPAARRAPAEMPRTSQIPGGGAARYFQRGPVAAASRQNYYQRYNRYFGNNGR